MPALIPIEEVTLIIFLMKRINFVKYYKYLSKVNFEKETKSFLLLLKDYYSEFKEVEVIKVEDLLLYFNVKRPVLKKNTAYQAYLTNLSTIELNEQVLKENLNAMLEKYFVSEIVYELTDVLDDVSSGKLESIKEKIEEFDNNKLSLKESKSPFIEDTIAEILQQEVISEGLQWNLDCLNEDVGPLRGGTLGHVFARVDTGKTSFMVSEGVHFASQLKDDEVLVWFNNEEKGTRVKLRICQSTLKCSKEQLMEYLDSAEQAFKDAGGDKIKIYDSAVIDITDIESILKEYNVRLVIIDQGDKIKFTGDKNLATHEKLKVVYGKFRELAKTYGCDIITAGQANGDAENRKWLKLDNMDNSKTGKPGELDYAIGIGKLYDDTPVDGVERRYIHLCKNKMNNGVHGMHSVAFHTKTATYADTVNSTTGVQDAVTRKTTEPPRVSIADRVISSASENTGWSADKFYSSYLEGATSSSGDKGSDSSTPKEFPQQGQVSSQAGSYSSS